MNNQLQIVNRIAFFVRAQIIAGDKREEILPITYADNYQTVMPHESNTIVATYDAPTVLDQATELRIDGYNVNARACHSAKQRKRWVRIRSFRQEINEFRELGNRHEKIDR